MPFQKARNYGIHTWCSRRFAILRGVSFDLDLELAQKQSSDNTGLSVRGLSEGVDDRFKV